MQKYEILEHTADLKIKAFGKTIDELFENVMCGMFEGAKYESENKEIVKEEIKVSSIDLPTLLVDFLSEALYLSETKKEVFHKVNFKKITEKEIEANLVGRKLKRMGVQIKGVTFHDLKIEKKNSLYQAQVLFDI